LTKHVVGLLSALPPGTVQRVDVGTRAVVVVNESGRLFALRDTCPHRGARLSDGTVVGALSSDVPGEYAFDGSRRLIKCPWHGWEFDLATGQSWCDPTRTRVKPYPVTVESGTTIAATLREEERIAGPYVADTVPVWIEDDYVVIDI
jgi:nitrite reductase/ring-hydroxylating ferredoxin subunit